MTVSNSASCNLRLSDFCFKKCNKFAFVMFPTNQQAVSLQTFYHLFLSIFYLSTFYQPQSHMLII